MTIRRGEPWGEPGPLAPEAPVARSDGELADLVAAAAADGSGLAEVGLVAGDLHRALGSPQHDGAALRRGEGVRYPIDLGEVLVERADGSVTHHLFAAHLEAVAPSGGRLGGGSRRWRSRTVVVMNGTHLGGADLGPRAHPNDGLLDVSDGSVPRKDVRAAARREVTGTHLPHPGIAERRTARYDVELDDEVELRVDGRPIGRSRRFEVRAVPDAVVVVA